MPLNDPMKDLQRLLSKQDFKSQAEVENFLKQFMNNPVPVLGKDDLSKEEQAEDLVTEAMGLPPQQAKKKIEQALALDPDSISAYHALGVMEQNPKNATKHLEKGIAIGRKRFFGDKAKDYPKGHFWGIYETRPFMRCLSDYAQCLLAQGTLEGIEKAFAVYEEILTELNPGDNMGVRDMYLTFCISHYRFDRFKHFAAIYDDHSAFRYFNNALAGFCLDGDSPQSRKLLAKALSYNPFVAPILISPPRNFPPPMMYSPGGKEEAQYYALFAEPVWNQIPGAVKWLKAQMNAPASSAPNAASGRTTAKKSAGKKK